MYLVKNIMDYGLDGELRRAKKWIINIITTLFLLIALFILIRFSHPIALGFKENLKLMAYSSKIILWEKNNPFDFYREKDSSAQMFMDDKIYEDGIKIRNKNRVEDVEILGLLLRVYRYKHDKYPVATEFVELKPGNEVYEALNSYIYKIPRDPSSFLNYQYYSDGKIYIISYFAETGNKDAPLEPLYKTVIK